MLDVWSFVEYIVILYQFLIEDQFKLLIVKLLY